MLRSVIVLHKECHSAANASPGTEMLCVSVVVQLKRDVVALRVVTQESNEKDIHHRSFHGARNMASDQL